MEQLTWKPKNKKNLTAYLKAQLRYIYSIIYSNII